MSFTRIPEPYAPAFAGPQTYRYAAGSSTTIDAQVEQAVSGETLARLRFYAASEAEIDVEPYLRRMALAEPLAAGATGFCAATGRLLPLTVWARGEQSERRDFLPAQRAAEGPLLSEVTPDRLIAPGEWDEVSVLCGEGCRAVLRVERDGVVESRTFEQTGGGVALFRMAEEEADAAELELEADGEAAGTIRYRFMPAYRCGMRVAWVNALGGVDHYTFPVVVEVTGEVERVETTVEGCRRVVECACEQRTKLVSAYEPQAMIRALAGIGLSPAVWALRGGRYEPIDVVSASFELLQHGTLQNVALQVRPARKGGALW